MTRLGLSRELLHAFASSKSDNRSPAAKETSHYERPMLNFALISVMASFLGWLGCSSLKLVVSWLKPTTSAVHESFLYMAH